MFSLRLRALAAALLLAAAPLAAKPLPKAHPALWVVRDADTTIWLFGTIHALPTGYQWRDPALDKAFAAAKELIIEAKLDSKPGEAAQLFGRLAADNARGLPPVRERIPARLYPTLEQLAAKTGWPPAALDKLETWAVGFILFGATVADLGVSSAAGVEQQLKALFDADRRPIAAFETGEQQLGYFDTLPESAQREFLESVLDDPAAEKKEFAAMLAAWSRGDETSIATSFDKDFKSSPVLREVLLAKRNAKWAETIANRMQQPGAVLVAVGAGHLAGTQSVQAMLKAKGFKVERVD